MKFENFIYSSLWVLFYLTFANCQTGRQPEVYYANLGSDITLSCKVGGGQRACFSTYTYSNREYPMAYLNTSRKYEVTGNSIGIKNVKATDAGFYACSSDCQRMRIDQISYYLQPMSNGQQVDTSKQFIAIPRFPSNTPQDDLMYVVVTNEQDQRPRGAALSAGEIAGLVVGLVVAFLLTVAIVVLLCCLWRRKKQQGEKILDNGQRSEAVSTEHSTVEDSNLPKNERSSLAQNKYDQAGRIQTKNVRGPNAFKPNDLGELASQDLPNVDINSHQGSRRGGSGSNQGSYIGQNNQNFPRNNSSQSGSYVGNNQQPSRQGSYQGSYNNQHPRDRQYSNQMEIPYENGHVPRPNRKPSESSNQNGIDGVVIQPPPPKNGPVNNKINFPSRQNNSQQPFATDNPNLRQIVKDTGFVPPLGNNNSQRQQPLSPVNNNNPSDVDNPNLRQIVKETGFNPQAARSPVQLPQYVSDDENINLQEIIKDSGFLADDILNSPERNKPEEPRLPKFKQRQPEYDLEPTRQQPQTKQRQPSQPSGDGGVTVVTARTPSTGNGSAQGFSVMPPTANRSNNSIQNQPPKYNPDGQRGNQKPLLPHLSYSQRIETTSTPMQVQQPSKSLRTQNTGGLTRPAKEGSTDV